MKTQKLSASQFCYDLAQQLAESAFQALCQNPCQQLFIVAKRDGAIWRHLRVASEVGVDELTVLPDYLSPALTLPQLASRIHDSLRREPILPPELFA
jgi:hypothetical protein